MRLNNDELQATAGLVLAAGFETTVNLLGNGIRMLLDSPEHVATLSARPELWPNAVEEILRLDSPVQMSARVARKDTEVAGTVGPARRTDHHLPGRGQPRPEGIRRPASLRHRTRQRRQASVVLRRPALLPRRRARAGGGRSRAADVLRPLSRGAAGRDRQPTRHPGAARMVVAADPTWQGANRCRFVTWTSERRCLSRPEPSAR